MDIITIGGKDTCEGCSAFKGQLGLPHLCNVFRSTEASDVEAQTISHARDSTWQLITYQYLEVLSLAI